MRERIHRALNDDHMSPDELRSLIRDLWQQIETDMPQTQVALEESENLLSSIYNTVDVGICITNEQGYFVRVNRAYCDIYGYQPEELLGNPFTLVVPPENHTYAQELHDRFIAGEPEIPAEWQVVHRSGRPLTIAASAVLLERRTGERLKITVVNDITERKRSEAALRESQRFIERMAETQPNILYVLNLDERRNIYANQAITNTLGYTPEEIQAMGGAFFSKLLHPDDMAPMQAHLDRFHDAANDIVEIDYRMKHRAGEWRWLSSREVVFTRDENNRPTEILGIAADVTEKRKAEEALHHAKQQAESASQAKSTFLAKMSHELRTPLNAIIGFAQLMAAESDHRQEDLDVIISSGEHLLTLINNVLEMSKIEAGRVVLEPGTFDLHRVLYSLQDMLALKAEAKSIDLTFTGVDDLPQYIYADESKLRQILLNLLSNAIKFTEVGKISLRVRYEDEHDLQPTSNVPPNAIPCRLYLEVEDTGCGIAEDELDMLFDAFAQTSSGRGTQDGTGLGLTLSREFIYLMGGDITVESEVNAGTRFRFDIMVLRLTEPIAEELQQRRRIVGLVPGQPRYRILVVEDKLDSSRLLTKLMTFIGFDVQAATNGAEALELDEAWQPHLIFMDVNMPVMNGIESTRQIRARGRTIPIIALTASVFFHERKIVMDAGCDDFIAKPFQNDYLLEKMSQHLGVQFIYAETPAAMRIHHAEQNNLSGLLQGVHREHLEALRQAAVVLDSQAAQTVIKELRQTHPHLAERLTNWVKHYRFDKITALIEESEML